MTPPFGHVGGGYDGDVAASLYARQNGCVICDNVAPACPQCSATESCQVTIPLTCKDCPTAYCAPDPNKINAASKPSSNNTGAIVGGVIGGLAAMAIITYLVWRFCIKTKREAESEKLAEHMRSKEAFDDSAAAAMQSKRASTHTVHSIASTVLTRASNIIQIAYIPGVTNRANPASPNVLVPPVPPIPLAHSESGSASPYDEQHFFTPGDLRNSTYSGISAFSDRTSYARTSYAPRSSVASTIYGKNAVVSPVPAQKGNFLKPSLVSVKSRAGSQESGDTVPAVPTVDLSKYEKGDKPPPSPAFSIGSAFFKNASTSTATTVRPQMIKVGNGGPKTIEIKSKASSGNISTISETPTSVNGDKSGVTIVKTSPAPDQGPFADPPTDSSSSSSKQDADAERESRRDSEQSKPSTSRGRSPFGDEHAVKES